MDRSEMTPELRRDLLRYLGKTSAERARVIAELAERTPKVAEIFMDLEADDHVRTLFEIALPQVHA